MGGEKQINKSAIKNFAIEARNTLIQSAITEAGFYGISENEISKPVQKGSDFEVYRTAAGTDKRIFGSDIKRRANLVRAIQEKGFAEVMEETAYTWFNRLIAIRFMEVNDYLPSRVRVLSSETGSGTPDLVNQFLDVDLNMSPEEIAQVQKAKDENQYDEAFRLLFIKTCNELNDILPGLFEKTDDYKELLLNLPYTSNGVVRTLVDTIPESNFNVNEGGQVEIIGWLYQYYNTEPKAKAFAKKGKLTKEEIPAVTQLFTPDWIVRYMVENSLGRLWIEHLLANGDDRSEQEIADSFGWKYYLPEAEQEPEVQAQLVQIRKERKDLTPEDILCIDPCQGSGHILVYLYDVLMQIYREEGYSERDAARSILENNLYGLDIDDRAYQLSYFAVLMKARQYDRIVLKKHIQPHVYSIQESNAVNRVHLKYFGTQDTDESTRNKAIKQLTYLLDTFKDAKEYGSILNVDPCDWNLLREYVENDVGQFEFEALGVDNTRKQLLPLIDIGKAMAQKYHVVTTNPPYMVVTNANSKLYEFIKKKYPDSKTDLYSVFMEKCHNLLVNKGYQAMITMHAWMFLSSFESLRKMVINQNIINMVHLGARAFEEIGGEVVQTTTFVLRNMHLDYYTGIYCRLLDGNSQVQKEKMYLSNQNRYKARQEEFCSVPGSPIAYWLPSAVFTIFNDNNAALGKSHRISQGMSSADNNRFLRLWFEVSRERIVMNCYSDEESKTLFGKWYPLNKGGEYRKWYGNRSFVVNYEHGGQELKAFPNAYVRNSDVYFKEFVSWSKVSTSEPAFRLFEEGFIFSDAGMSIISKSRKDSLIIIAVLNSKVTTEILRIFSPTMNFEAGQISKIPILDYKQYDQRICDLAQDCIQMANEDWDSFETSWDFIRHPLITIIPKNRLLFEIGSIDLAECYMCWETECTGRFNKLKENEEQLNRIFISAYGLEDELSPEVEDKDISVRKANLQREMKSLISYAVGCMFGRYSLDVEDLAYAGGNWKEAYATKYKTFMPDEDAIIPITDEEYFKDDIVARFVDFVRIVYGEETLEDNLRFIADALGNKGDTSRAVIRNYFLNDFYKDHCNTYSVTGSGKRPIYWLFDSGKQNGFKALIYIHRYTPDTVGLIRSVYLHNAQEAIQNSLKNAEYVIATSASAVDRAANTRKRDKYIKQLNELRPYYQAISHVALQRIEMDLDDGVKKNYQLFQGIEISSEGKKKQTIDLLAKI